MPAKSERQRRAAMSELIRRKVGGYKKQRRKTKQRRPFGSATIEQLKDFSKR